MGCDRAEWPFQHEDELPPCSHLRIGIFPCPRASLQLTSVCANLLRFQAFRE